MRLRANEFIFVTVLLDAMIENENPNVDVSDQVKTRVRDRQL